MWSGQAPTGNKYDPFVGKYTEDELLSAATQLLFSPHEGDGKIFTQRGALMLTQIFLASRIEGYPLLLYARQLIRDGPVATAAKLETVSKPLATRFLDADFDEADLSDRFFLSSWSTLSAKLYPLLTQTVARSLAASDFTAEELLTSDEPITVYLRWPEIHLPRLAPLVRLLWGSLISSASLMRRGEPPSPRSQITPQPSADGVLPFGFPSSPSHSLMWNTAPTAQRCSGTTWRPKSITAPSDLDTARCLEDRLGRHSMYARSATERKGEKVSQGLSEQAVPLMTAWEVMRMRDEDILLFHRALLPILARRMDWRNIPELKQKHCLTPPELQLLRLHEREPRTIWHAKPKK